jgi:hypothetical protein
MGKRVSLINGTENSVYPCAKEGNWTINLHQPPKLTQNRLKTQT